MRGGLGILSESYFLPGDLESQIAAFVERSNHRRHHESLDNLTPAGSTSGAAKPSCSNEKGSSEGPSNCGACIILQSRRLNDNPDEPEPPLTQAALRLKNLMTDMFDLKLSHRTQRFLRTLRIIPSAKHFSDHIIGAVAEASPILRDYDIAPFDKRPIRHVSTRPNGWVRVFRGDLRLEYPTGLIYSGIRPIFGSTDSLHSDIPPTRPVALFRRRVREVDQAIVLNSRWDSSYYHFLFDVVPKLEIIDRAGIAANVPVIVREELAGKTFFIEAIGLGLFGARPVIVQGRKEVIAAQELYVVRPDAYTERQLSFPAKRFGSIADPRARDRLYISRSGTPGTSRQITNEEDLVAKLRELGFSVIDPGTMPLADQVAHFARSSIIVGPHGSGLANILFRYGAPMALVEMINPTKKYHHHFFQISTHCGYFYRATLNNAERGDEQVATACADIDAVVAAVEEAIEWESSVYDRPIASPEG